MMPRSTKHTKVKTRSASKAEAKTRAKTRPKPASKQKKSKVEQAMQARLGELDPGTPRFLTLKTAIDFKRSWVELAQALVEVSRAGEFKDWGYRTFEAYAQRELHLRKETAQKLVRSYDFLSAYQPEVLDGSDRDEGPLPSLEAIDVLARARDNPYLSERDYRSLVTQVFDEDWSPQEVRKAVRERAPEAHDNRVATEALERVPRCLSLAERLYGLIIEGDDIPDRVVHSMEEVVTGLRRMLTE